MIRYDLPEPIKGFIAEKYLYDMDETKQNWIPCRVFAVDVYPGEALALTILLNDGSVFNYLPLDAFSVKKTTDIIPYTDLVYNNCVSGAVAIKAHQMLKSQPVCAYLKRSQTWIDATYLCSIDFYESNDLLNLVVLENGQLAALPNHKLKFGKDAPRNFTQYRKLHSTWKV